METAGYWVALLAVVVFPPVLLVWLVIHPFTHRWRRLPAAATYSVVIVILVALMAVIFLLREPLLRIRFGVSLSLVILAFVFFAAAICLGRWIVRSLRPAAILGLPEISAKHYPGRLVTDGIYARLRHPRYVEGGLALASMALFSNYLAVYVLLAVYFPLIRLVVFFEERELKERFGEEYERYCREVPRFVPKLVRRKKVSE